MKSWATPMDEALMTCLFDTGVLDWLTRTNVQPCDLAPILHWRTQFRSHILVRSGRIVLLSRTEFPRFQIKPNRDLDIVDTNLALAWRSQHQLPLNSWALAEGIDNGNWKQLGMKASMSCIWQLIEYLSWSLSWQRLPFSSSLMNWYARLAGVLLPAACTWSWKASYVYLMFLLLVGDLEVGFRKWDEYFSNEQ